MHTPGGARPTIRARRATHAGDDHLTPQTRAAISIAARETLDVCQKISAPAASAAGLGPPVYDHSFEDIAAAEKHLLQSVGVGPLLGRAGLFGGKEIVLLADDLNCWQVYGAKESGDLARRR